MAELSSKKLPEKVRIELLLKQVTRLEKELEKRDLKIIALEESFEIKLKSLQKHVHGFIRTKGEPKIKNNDINSLISFIKQL